MWNLTSYLIFYSNYKLEHGNRKAENRWEVSLAKYKPNNNITNWTKNDTEEPIWAD